MGTDRAISINDFTYHLPEDRIALTPLAERDQSKLLVYRQGQIVHSRFSKLSDYLPSHSILFFNNTKVIPARLFFQKNTGATIEVFLLNPISPSPIVSIAMTATQKSQWHCAIGNLKRWKENTPLVVETEHFALDAKLIDRANAVVEFTWSPADLTFSEVLEKVGSIPLPPYIKRKAEREDSERYQTVYSKEKGAVAAPTAGLHFTDKVLESLKERNIVTEFLTLHVSAGTFQPVKTANAKEHTMHAEQIIITRKNVEQLLIADRPVVAVGTTSMRSLESLYWYGVKLVHHAQADFIIHQQDAYTLKPCSKEESLEAVLKKMDDSKTDQLIGESSIYIMPGYDFKLVEVLITNFHQPGSTLILLVAAFVGDDWKKIYGAALSNDYRFLSYGDSSLLFRNH
ncbi:MAG: S-adenosylmethionine:tRNA ribosyltransferase-isomerase [Bacteroidetes bacterium]|nr:S-adenosylmethionine:tRNA ribosyltransferase-isomerase [Bacteroidota bacterium]